MQQTRDLQPKMKLASLSHGSEITQVGGGVAAFQNSKDGNEQNQNTMQMFYGDYVCDDEPEEDDHSNQQMSGSQFSDDLDDRVDDEDGESEADSPVRISENAHDLQSQDKSQMRKKNSQRAKESLDPSQKMTDNHELME